MKVLKTFPALAMGVGLMALASPVSGASDDYLTVARHNVFRLKPADSESSPQPSQNELPQLRLQGLANLLGQPQALLHIQTKGRLTGTEASCILAEGQSQAGVKVLRIDMNSATVWVANQGEEQVLTLAQ